MKTRLLLGLFFAVFSNSLLSNTSTSLSLKNEQISVIFDLNGVLVETGGATRLLGIGKFIAYLLSTNPFIENPLYIKTRIKEKLFNFLSSLEPRSANQVSATDDQGALLPECMCNWMKGMHTPAQLRTLVENKLAEQSYSIEKALIGDIAHLMFTPELFVQTQNIVPEAISLVKQLKKEGYKLYVLSNFCAESFAIIQARHSDFFQLFDGIIISGQIGFIKPDPAIYQYVLHTYRLDPTTVFFIDDTLINVQAAQNIGIASLICPTIHGYFGGARPDIATVEREFYSWREQRTANVVPSL